MKRFRSWFLSLIMILIGTTCGLAGCDEYRRLELTLDKTEVVVFLSNDPEENLFDISATVSGYKSGTSTDVIFEIMSTQGCIELDNVKKDGDKTTATYKAVKRGDVEIHVSTVEGNRTKVCTVSVQEAIEDITFTHDTLAINRGAEKDFLDFINFVPENTSQRNITLSVVVPGQEEVIAEGEDEVTDPDTGLDEGEDVGDPDEDSDPESGDTEDEENTPTGILDQIKINGTKVSVAKNSTITEFTLKVVSNDNAEIVKTITVNVVDTINTLRLEYNDASLEGSYREVQMVNGVYSITLAQNAPEEYMYKKFLKLKGYLVDDEDEIDKGYIVSNSEFTIKMLVLNEGTNQFEPVDLPYSGEYFEVSKQLNSNGSFQLLQRRKGEQTIKFVVDYTDYMGEFTTEVILKVNVIGLPTQIEVLYENEVTDTITLFDTFGAGVLTGTTINLNVIGVGNEQLIDEPVLISFETEGESKIYVYNKNDRINALNLTNPITIDNDCPLLLRHGYASDEEAPNDLYMVVTSVKYDKIFAKVKIEFVRGEIVLGIVPEYRIPYGNNETEVEIQGLSSTFNKNLLKFGIADQSIVKINEDILLTENRVVLVPQGKFGSTTLVITAPNGVKSRTCKITVFEELLEETTITFFGNTIKTITKDAEIKTFVVKTSQNFPITYNVNEKYNYLITGMTSEISVESESTSQTLAKVVDGSIRTNAKTGIVNVVVKITGYNSQGELAKVLTYKFKMDIKAPLISATPNAYVANIYDRNSVKNYENQFAKYNVTFKVNPVGASFNSENITWIIKVGNEIIQPIHTLQTQVGLETITIYKFDYANNIVYIETTTENIQSATVYCDMMSDSFVFNAICQIRQTFPNEKGVEVTNVNEDVNVIFTVLKSVKVNDIILNNISKTSVPTSDGGSMIKNSYTFDTRDMTIDTNGKFTSGNVYVVNYSISPANATIKELSVTHTQASSDLEVLVDHENQTIIIKVNRQINGETVIYITAKDSIASAQIVQQEIYLKVANGTKENPFEIHDASGIEKIRNSLNSHYILISDIDLSSISNFEPIGTNEKPFVGSLNGAHEITLGNTTVQVFHVINSLKISLKQSESTGSGYFGLFGYVGESGAILNINLQNVSFSIYDRLPTNETFIGAIAGFSKGVIYNCTVTDSSYVQSSQISAMFTDSTRQAGIDYRVQASNKTAYIGGIVGMLVENSDLRKSFANNLDLINGITYSFENNKAFITINAVSTIEASSVVAGGLVGYNLGARVYTSNVGVQNVVTAINTIPGNTTSNLNSVYGGVVGVNFGSIENYTVKPYIKGLSYVGGVAGYNLGSIKNTTVIPVIRGRDNVGGITGYNVSGDAIELDDLIPTALPNVYTGDETTVNATYAVSTKLFETMFSKSSDVVLLKNLKGLIENNKVQFVDNNQNLSVYNSGIIGEYNVGGLIGYNYQVGKRSLNDFPIYIFDENIVNNSVYSYVTTRTVEKYYADDEANKYFGDIVVISSNSSSTTIANVGGLVGAGTHANIIKGFVNANININTDLNNNVGGIIGAVGTNLNGMLRIVDSHSNGLVYARTANNNIGAFIGNADNIYDENYNTIPFYQTRGGAELYNIQSSYSLLRQKIITLVNNGEDNFIEQIQEGYVQGFGGTDTTNECVVSLDTTGIYDKLTAINSFYIGFTVNYLAEVTDGEVTGFDFTTLYADADPNNIKTITFTYEDAVKGYTKIGTEDNFDYFYYFNLETETKLGNFISYSNVATGSYIKSNVTSDGDPTDTFIARFTYLSRLPLNHYTSFKIYYIENDSNNEDGFGNNTETYTENDVTYNVINTNYNWYHNVYEYSNSANEKYKAYNGLPIILNSQRVFNNNGTFYDNELNFVLDLPPMGISVEFNVDNKTSFIYKDEIVLSVIELDSKYYNSDGTLTEFNGLGTVEKQNFSLDVKNSIANANTYRLKDIIDIKALPKFVGATSLEYRSVNGLIKFGYNANGEETLQVIGAGKDQIIITSKYNKEITYTAYVNIISKVDSISLQRTQRSTTPITSLNIVRDVESSFYAKISSQFTKLVNSELRVFDLVQRQDIGIRYYFANQVAGSLSIYHDSNMVEAPFTLNGLSNFVCEEVNVEIEGVNVTKYVYYIDVASSEVSILGNIATDAYSTIFAVPYVVLNNENFFIVQNEEIEEVANSYTKGATGETGTFSVANKLVKPLEIRIFNETFNLKVDKTSVEFSAYTQPKITVTLGTDNFDDELYYVVSNGTQETIEQRIGNSASMVTVLDNLQLFVTAPINNTDSREKVYTFELSVLKIDGIYQTIADDMPFTIVFYTKQNGETKFIKTCNVTIIPQPVNEISMLHYPSSEYEEVVSASGKLEFIPKSNEVAYENIIPGYTGLLKINLSPYYGNVSTISITSNVVGGKTINFEQLVYNEYENSYSYQTAYPLADKTDNGIVALPRSKVLTDDYGNSYYGYDGYLYIRTILPSNTVTGSMFTITVTVYAIANGQLVTYPSKPIELEAITPPGLYVSYKGSSNGVVAIGTDNIITVKGDGLENALIDFNKKTRINFPTGQFEEGVGGSVRITDNNDGTYTLSVSREVPQGTTINLVAYTQRTINNKIYEAEAKLTLKVAKFVVESITVEYVTDGVFQTKLNQKRPLNIKLKDVSYNPNIPGINKQLEDFEAELSTKLNNGLGTAWYKRTYNMDGSFNDRSLVEGDYGTFVISFNEETGETFIRNTVKSTADILVAKAVINYQFGSTNDIVILNPNESTISSGIIDAEYTVELECEFTFNVLRDTNDETPEPISNVEQFLAMEAGINYILTEDIVLTNYKPISTEIASLDGNGYVITIKNFDTSLQYNSEGQATTDTSEINLGLFDTVAEGTILKNITIEIVPLNALHGVREEANNSTQDMLIDVSMYESVNFGFIAATNKGTITNAQVVNDVLANEIRNERESLLAKEIEGYEPRTYQNVEGRTISVVKIGVSDITTSSQIAGLVAINDGYITNSRVENITINGSGYVAGIAVQNNNTISSTYFKGANLLNQSSDLIENAGTAGLVVFNGSGATIQYCYTMARESWSYQHEANDENEEVEGSINWNVNSDITGISTVEKNLFTGVYNSSTLTISDGSNIVSLVGDEDPVYIQAMQALRNNTTILTLRAVNSGINVDTDAAGFVYENSGTISNSYANILVNASHSAGFVFTSTVNAIIEDCYSLSSVRIESDAHSPFTGKTVNDVQNSYNATSTNISYSHYLSIDETVKFEYTAEDGSKTPYTIIFKDKFYDTDEPATSLTTEELRSYASFQGYAFNNDFESNVEILRSVWFIPSIITAESYDTYSVIKENFKHSYYSPNRPELVSANIRTLSIRYLIDSYETSETLTYSYVSDLEIGLTIRNPYLVYNATTFNDYGTLAYDNVNRNYMRFISDITFEGSSLNDIKAETYNVDFSGDIDGNGMYINDLKLIAESQIETTKTIDHLGLFGTLCETKDASGESFNAIVRNLNINVSSIDGTGIMYVGVLAGEMKNASAFNIKVLGENVYVNGQNAVGGVVGKISGDSELVNIATNVSVSATNKSTLTGYNFNAYDGTEETLKGISYAGGVVGIVDVNDRGDDVKTAQKYARIRKIDVYGNTTISGDIVGGLFGYIGTLTTASDTHFTITNDGVAAPRLVAKYSAGGLVGENRGRIERSYISHSNQTEINEEIKANINSTTHNSTGSDKVYARLFNSSALAQSYFIGGIAGINLGGTISDSYANVHVINGVSSYAGGVVGLNAGGTIRSVYTTGSVYAKTVGGFIGMAVNGAWLEDGLTVNSTNEAYLSLTALKEEGFVINNIVELLDQVDLGSLILNSIVSANVWRAEDLNKINYSNIGSFIGKAIDTNKITAKLISTASEMSREMAETNVFANATVTYDTVNQTKREIQEIAQINSGSGYSITETTYDSDSTPLNNVKYVYGKYGVLKKEETQKYYYYSRLKQYGSLRTMEEIINRNLSVQIATLQYENKTSSNAQSGNYVKYALSTTNPYNLPKTYKGWSAIYWEGTGTNTSGEADSTQVFPTLIARPNVAVVRVYDVEDLKLIYTLLSSEFILMNDIDLSEEIWTPVGTETDPFTGSIHSDADSNGDYNSWTIKNVSISAAEGNSVGLLGTISGAELYNFNVNINRIAIDKSTEYQLNVGGLVGLVDSADISKIHDVLVIGGNDVTASNDSTKVVGVGTSGLTYEGTSDIIATNISTMGGVIGSALNAEISNLNAVNLNIYSVDNTTSGEETNAGAYYEDDGDFNAFGGVIGHYNIATGVTTVSNLNSKNVKLLTSSETTYAENLYIGGAIGYAKDIYLKNVYVSDFYTGHGTIYPAKDTYAGGIVGYVENGIVFNASVINQVPANAQGQRISDLVGATSIDKTLYINIGDKTNTTKSAYVGGAFGILSGLQNSYSAVPNYIGAVPVRNDSNPFGKIGGNSYIVENISNAIVSNIEVELKVDSSFIAQAYVGGIAGKTITKLYNAITYGNIKTTTEQDLYVGGLIGLAQNYYIQNAYSYRDIVLMSLDNSVVDNYSVFAGGLIGDAISIGNALNTANIVSNVVSNGNIVTALIDASTGNVTKRLYHKSIYLGGMFGRATNIAVDSAISNTQLNVVLPENTQNVLNVGGFVGSFIQTNGGVNATIQNSYSTGVIEIDTSSYMTNGGLGGFVGYVSTQTTNTTLTAGGNSASIRNCYTISRVVTTNTTIFYDKETKGGFLGRSAQDTTTLLVNCYFNKELFNIYENSTNELIIKRYDSSKNVITRNFGVGLTLNQMVYEVANTSSDVYTSVLAQALSSETLNNKNGNEVIVDETSGAKLNKWTIENNKYPLLNFVFEAYTETEPNPEDLNALITKTLYYDYQDASLNDNLYSIRYLLSGSRSQFVENNAPTDSSALFDGNIYTQIDDQNVEDIVVSQYNGSKQNPVVYTAPNTLAGLDDTYYVDGGSNEDINGTEELVWDITLNSELDGVYKHDLTNKAIIVDVPFVNFESSYSGNAGKLQNATILFKNSTNVVSWNSQIGIVDETSLIYGLNGTINSKIANKNYGTIRGISGNLVNVELITENYGTIEDVLLSNTTSSKKLVSTNEGVVNSVEFTSIATSTAYSLISDNENGYARNITLNITSSLNTYRKLSGVNPVRIADDNVNTSVINVTFSNISNKKAYYYYSSSGVETMLYDRSITIDADELPAKHTTFYNEVKGSIYRTFVTSLDDDNERMHPIDFFGVSKSEYSLDSNRNGYQTDVDYDFANDWVILTGVSYNNMPILRATLQSQYYNTYIASGYYWTGTTTTDFMIESAQELADAAYTISKATSGTYNVYIATNISLENKLWTPITVNSNVTVNLSGYGVSEDDNTKDRRIQNISVLETNNNAGFFGTVFGKVNVSNLVFEYGYVASVLGYDVSNEDDNINSIVAGKKDFSGLKGGTTYSVGAVIGYVYGASSTQSVVSLNRVGNQYIYVKGNAEHKFYVGGLIGYAQQGYVGIKDSYVNSPFMGNTKDTTSGIANGKSNLYLSNTYVANMDAYLGVDNFYVYNAVANANGFASGSVTINGTSYPVTEYNYYLYNTETGNTTTTGTTFVKLRTGVLPQFDWLTNWTRLQGINDGLPYNLTEIEYWINEGKTAVSGTDYSQSGSTYTIKTEKGLAWVAYNVDNGIQFTGSTISLQKDVYDLSGKIWTPIGREDAPFSGTVKSSIGNSVVKFVQASSFYSLKEGETTISENNIGLFGYTKDANISDIEIQGSIISGTNNVGSLIGYAENTIVNECSVTLIETTSEVSYVSGKENIGGLIGYLKNTDTTSRYGAVISNSENTALVRGTKKVAGIVGYLENGVVQLVENSGTITAENYETITPSDIGGIVGQAKGSVYEAINNAKINAYSVIVDSATNVGGIIGYMPNYDKTQLINSLNYGDVYGSYALDTGLIVGNAETYSLTDYKIITSYSNAKKYIKDSSTSTSKFVGNYTTAQNFYEYGSEANIRFEVISDSSIWYKSADDTYVFDANDSSDYFNVTNNFTMSSSEIYEYIAFLVTKRPYYNYENGKNLFNINLNTNLSIQNEYVNTSDAYSFQGTFASNYPGIKRQLTVSLPTIFDSNSGFIFNTIKNSTIKDISIILASSQTIKDQDIDNVGLLSGQMINSNVMNVSTTLNSAITLGNVIGSITGYAIDCAFENCSSSSNTITGENYVGGMVGYLTGSSTMTASNTTIFSNSIAISGNTCGGGIVGYLGSDSTISKANNSATISLDSSTNSENVGGIVGYNEGTVDSCNNTGKITGKHQNIGGIAGVNISGGVIKNCTSSNEISTGSEDTGGIVGENTGEVTGNTFSGTVCGYTDLGGIVGYNPSGTVTNNSMNGDIQVYRTDYEDGKVKGNLSYYGFGYTIEHDGDGVITTDNGETSYFGRIEFGNYMPTYRINFVVGNDSDADSNNTVSDDSKIIFNDYYVKYDLSISGHGKDVTGSIGMYDYYIWATFTINAVQYSTFYITYKEQDYHDYNQNARASRGDKLEGSSAGWWSIGASYDAAYDNLINKQIEEYSFDFTGTW